MVKGGLFFVSIGMLFILFSANQNTAQYDIFNFTTGVFLLIVGIIMYVIGNRKEKARKKNEKDEVK